MARLNRQQSQENTRHRLRLAAAQEFAVRGISAASIDGIAGAAGFTRGAFYANYRSKHDLLLELLDEEQTREADLWKEIVQQSADIELALATLERRSDAAAERDGRELLLLELQLEAARNPEFGAAYGESTRHILDLLAEVVAAIALKAGRTGIDAPAVALTLRSLWLGMIAQRRWAPNPPSAGRVVTDFLRQTIIKSGDVDRPVQERRDGNPGPGSPARG